MYPLDKTITFNFLNSGFNSLRMKLERLFYLGYHFKETDFSKLSRFMNHVCKTTGISRAKLWKDVISSSLRYNVSLIDYFLFRFYEKNDVERLKWSGTGTMYEYQKKMNPPSQREVLSNKPTFYQVYAPYIRHNMVKLEDLKENKNLAEKILGNPTGKVVLKSSEGQCGNGIEIWNSKELNPDLMISQLSKTGNDMAEDFVEQHDQLNELSPSGLNTVRIITQLDKNNEVHILGARLRITVNSSVDNLAAGNIAASINLKNGIIESAGVYSDITKNDETHHPVTGVQIEGFKVPYWEESLNMVKEAALSHTGNRSIGWDVAVTNNGPELIEGNHDWCKLLWQLPVKKGLKPVLEKFEQEFNS